MAPLEALIPATISDIFFLEERGYQSSLFNLGLFGGVSLAWPICGAIQQASSVANAFYGMGGAFALMLILQFFFWPKFSDKQSNSDSKYRPETAYRRPRRLDLDITTENSRFIRDQDIGCQ